VNTTNKTVFITGTGRGLGKALVNQALLSGAKKVYAAARKLETPIPWDGSRVVPMQLDLSDPESIQSAVRAAEDIDVLINNAGTYTSGKLIELSEADLRRDLDTNFFGTLRVIRAFAPVLARKTDTAIVNIMSIAAFAGIGGLGAYCASKAALLSATETLRVELKKQGTVVHAVFPGPIDTEMAKNVAVSKAKPDLVARMIFEGVNAGLEDIFPDEMSKAIGAQWLKDPKSVEKSLGEAPL
jgi:NAD(P)-dependent dehydrogenase (short-subunit alcohol dehydrogenase family)